MEMQRMQEPFVRQLCDIELMFAKTTITRSAAGEVEILKEYAPGIQAHIDDITGFIHEMRKQIRAAHFPEEAGR